MIAEQPATLATSDGVALEARIALPDAPRGAIVVCHPHPLYGGDMDNPVVVRVQEVCAGLGFATLRFNFRGVGGSTGTHDQGRGEQHDVEAALAHLEGQVGGVPLAIAGYSFGSVVAARVAARRPGLAGLVLVAPPVDLSGFEAFDGLATFGGSLLVVAGDGDEYAGRKSLDELVRRLPGASVTLIEGANHFFFGKLYPLGEAVAGWAARLEAGQPGGRRRAG